MRDERGDRRKWGLDLLSVGAVSLRLGCMCLFLEQMINWSGLTGEIRIGGVSVT